MHHFTIIGVGLLGGSLGLAIKRRIVGARVVGCGHREASLIDAKGRGAIDDWTLDPAAAVADAECVVLCVPVGQIGPWLAKIAPHLRPGAVVTDVGSTKAAIVAAGEQAVRPPAFFVGSHPMAGGSQTGVAAARDDLFDNATCVLTPTPATDATALAKVETLWTTLGMRLVRHTPAEHDRLVALVSHLPHAVAAALVAVQQNESIELRGKGFTDTTRVAAGDAELWRDIFVDNRQNVIAAVDRLIAELGSFKQLMSIGNADALTQWLRTQGKRRGALTAPSTDVNKEERG